MKNENIIILLLLGAIAFLAIKYFKTLPKITIDSVDWLNKKLNGSASVGNIMTTFNEGSVGQVGGNGFDIIHGWSVSNQQYKIEIKKDGKVIEKKIVNFVDRTITA